LCSSAYPTSTEQEQYDENNQSKRCKFDGLPVRSQLKVGVDVDYCKICHLGCMFMEGKKQEICDQVCDRKDYCKSATSPQV
jgi:hypothetical protein